MQYFKRSSKYLVLLLAVWLAGSASWLSYLSELSPSEPHNNVATIEFSDAESLFDDLSDLENDWDDDTNFAKDQQYTHLIKLYVDSTIEFRFTPNTKTSQGIIRAPPSFC